MSPLHLAVQNDHVQTAEVLLRAGISQEARTKVDRTPLHMAAQNGHLESVKLLLRHGADVNCCDMVRVKNLVYVFSRLLSHLMALTLFCHHSIIPVKNDTPSLGCRKSKFGSH